MVKDKKDVEPRHGLDDHNERHIGIAWYRREQWNRLLEVSADREDLEDSYDEWLTFAEASLNKVKQQRVIIHKIDVDIDELVQWCRSQNRPVNMETRTEYVIIKLKERYPGSDVEN